MQLSSTTFCLCSSLLLVVVHAAVTPKPSAAAAAAADSKPSADSNPPADAKAVTSTSSSSSSSKSAAPKAPPKSATAAPTKDSAVSDDQLEKLLLDRRYLSRQLKCTLGEGVCDPVGRRLKSFAPLVLRGNCPQCTPTETRQIQKVLSHVQRNYPKEWSKIIQQFTGNRK